MDEVSSSNGGEPRGMGLRSKEGSTPWRPSQLVFRSYERRDMAKINEKSSHIRARRPLVARLTKDIVETYRICNPQFKYSEEFNPKRYLTSPSTGVLNDGYDNVNSDLILSVNHVMINPDTHRRYIVKEVLGHGTFGQVAKCLVPDSNSFVAVKIIKNQPAYHQQALVEVSILTTLNRKYDPEDKHHIVRIYDYFVHQNHLCISFELLNTNLYELIKLNEFRGLSLTIVQLFSKQILRGLGLLKEAGIIHCDLKPENILLCAGKSAEVKVIDFGSACMEDRTVYSYIQSRYYRSPEVLLGYRYTTAIDMWSFGCIVAELFLGLPLFPGASEFDLLRRMIKILGGQPPDYILDEAKSASKFFKVKRHDTGNCEPPVDIENAYQVLAEEEFEQREKKKPSIGKEYFKHMNLEAIVTNYPYKTNLPKEDINKESRIRLALIDFLRGLVEFDPAKRWSPFQASRHPFITGEPFTCPYRPPPETPHLPVAQNFKVDHHPGGGHWGAAGLSPNIPGRNRVHMQNSPRYQMVSYSQYNSYGSVGSPGSYNDGTGLGSSCGSYGDNNNFYAYYSPGGPSGFGMHTHGVPMLGGSPNTMRIMQNSHGSGLGMSPSAGSFAPLPLGTSPSQYTPPNYSQLGGSPGKYGPTSPARNSSQGSPLKKMAAAGQYNRRNNWGPSGNFHPQESSPSYGQGQFMDSSNSNQIEGNSQTISCSHSHLQSRSGPTSCYQLQGGSGITSGYPPIQNIPTSVKVGPSMHVSSSAGVIHDDAETGTLDPCNWDPSYSVDQLLQESGSDENCIASDFSKALNLDSTDKYSQAGSVDMTGVRKYNRAPTTFSNRPNQRPNGPTQAFQQGEMASAPSACDPHSRFSRYTSNPSYSAPHTSQNGPSRLGQQPVQQLYHGRPSMGHSHELNNIRVQLPPSHSNSGGQRSPGSSSYSNGMTWGRRGSNPRGSRGRKD